MDENFKFMTINVDFEINVIQSLYFLHIITHMKQIVLKIYISVPLANITCKF